MDTKIVFREISSQMISEFKKSGQVNHQGAKGAYRENALEDFLLDRRLPERYGIGSGEVVGPIQNVSKQCDLIIYDKLNGFSLLYQKNTQVYPIECVAGIIEVKSSLSKTEFLTALENIKSVKSLVPNEITTTKVNEFISTNYKRPLPFGAVFAYRLDGNSLESLEKNLSEWEKDVPKEFWPNVIAVLDEGLIFHYSDGLRNVYSNSDLQKAICAGHISYKSDTLFKFYATLIDLCASTHLGPVELSRYFDYAERVGPYVVSNHEGITKSTDNGVYKLNERFITKIINACASNPPLTHGEFLQKRFGIIPEGMTPEDISSKVYFYNPDNLKGMHEIENPVAMVDGKAIATTKMIDPCHYILVNNQTYYIPQVYITENDLELMPDKKLEDL